MHVSGKHETKERYKRRNGEEKRKSLIRNKRNQVVCEFLRVCQKKKLLHPFFCKGC